MGADTQSIGQGESPAHNPTEGANPSLVLTWNLSGELTKIEKTVGALTYKKEFTWAGGFPTIITDWVEV